MIKLFNLKFDAQRISLSVRYELTAVHSSSPDTAVVFRRSDISHVECPHRLSDYIVKEQFTASLCTPCGLRILRHPAVESSLYFACLFFTAHALSRCAGSVGAHYRASAEYDKGEFAYLSTKSNAKN